MRVPICLAALLITVAAPAEAQLFAAEDSPIAYGHHHIYGSDLDEMKRFWVDGLGGREVEFGDFNLVAFPNVMVFLTERAPTGGTKGSVVNHVGFEVPNLRAAIERVQGEGFPMVTREELPATLAVEDHIARAGANQIAYVMGPDGTKVELMQISSVGPMRMHHVHWATQHGEEMQAWYAEHLGVTPGVRIGQPAGDVPGANLTFGPSPEPTVSTGGRVLDHIGFEVKDLRGLLQRLEASGITLDMPYTELPEVGAKIAFITDPWGTRIELHEGLVSVR